MIFIGIDPGASGGIAWVTDVEMYGESLMETERDILDQLEGVGQAGECFAVIEEVHAMPKVGCVAGFKLGRSYGFLRGCLHALQIPFESVSPARWQRAMGVPKGEPKDKKKITKAKAQELFPSVPKITHRTADAILLAEYCRITRARTLTTPAEARE